MKKSFILITFLLVGFQSISVFAKKKEDLKKELIWVNDVNKAQEMSQKSKKPIFAMFTGSDWCGWCKKLHNDVFSKPEFIEWANKNVILLELDFPRYKKLPEQLAQQNNELQQAFQVRGYPTIWIFYLNKGEEGKKFSIAALGSLGYPSGSEPGKEQFKFLDEANQILKNKTTK